MADSSVKATSVDTNALYYEVSPTIICVLRLYNVAMLLMILVAFILCLVKGHENSTHYLLASNLVLSSLISIVVNWWYRNGDLGADKHWYIFLVATVIIFQCITTDVYVFHTKASTPGTTTVPTKAPVTWRTINSSTLTPPTTGHTLF